jgi:rubrerythrin
MAWKGSGVRIPISPQMQSKKFQRRIEDFVCEKCGAEVKGNGYTDHCPICLWGRHVDVNPGDRAAACGGMMEPVRAEVKSEKYLLYYICKKCGHNFRLKSMPGDNLDAIIKLINK